MEHWNDGILGPFVFRLVENALLKLIESLQKKQTDKKMNPQKP
jgi:hypothetical protein